MVSAAINSDSAAAVAPMLTGAVIAALHPVMQHPVQLDTGTDAYSAISVSNLGSNALLRAAKKVAPNIVFLLCCKPLNEQVLAEIKPASLVGPDQAGMVVIMGTGMDPMLSKRKKKLAKEGVVLTTTAEFGELIKTYSNPELFADALGDLVGIS
jgi:hypothetical protein